VAIEFRVEFERELDGAAFDGVGIVTEEDSETFI